MKNMECSNCFWYGGYCTNRDANSTCTYNAYYAWEPKYKCESTAPWACDYLVRITGGKMTGCSGIETCKYCVRRPGKDEEKAQSQKKKDDIQQLKEVFR